MLLAGLGVCHGDAQWETWGRSSLFWLSLSSWRGQQIPGELQELLVCKDKPCCCHPGVRERVSVPQEEWEEGGEWEGAGTWGWELEEQLHFLSNSQYVAPRHKGWHFRYCWGKVSPRLPPAPLCIAENHGKITNQSSDSNKKSG